MAAPMKETVQVPIKRILRAWKVSEANDCEGDRTDRQFWVTDRYKHWSQSSAHNDRSAYCLDEGQRIWYPCLYCSGVEILTQIIELDTETT